MTMLTLHGQVVNVLETPKGTKRDGSEYGGYHQVQMICEEPLRNGERRMQLFTLATDVPEAFKRVLGRHVSVPVGVFARAGTLHFYLQKGAEVVVDE